MKQAFFRISFLMCLFVSATGFSTAQTASSVSGRVVDANGAPISGARIVLERADVRLRLEAISERDGSFEFRFVPRGEYELLASARTFGSLRRAFRVPAETPADITLGPAPIAAVVSVAAVQIAGTPESLMEIPGSIDRVDSYTLERSRLFNFSEALRKVAGVNVRDEEGFGLRPNIGIRGTNPTRSTKVLLLEDGIPLAYAPYGDNSSYYHPPIERFESIEVLKGAGQIAYGPQTVGGVINYITPNPTEDASFGIKLIGGNRSYLNGSFTGSGTIGRTGLYANYTRKQGDGARAFTNSELNDLSTKVLQTINSRHAITAKFSYYGEDSNVTYSGLTEAEFADDPRGNIFRNDFFYGDRYGFSLAHAAILGSTASLNTTVYANFFTRHWWRQSSNSSQRPNRLNVDPDCLSLADLNTTCGNEGRLRDYDTYGFEPKFLYNYDFGNAVRGELQTGFRVHLERQDRRQENGDLPDNRSGMPVEINKRRTLAYSGFVQNRFIFGDLAITPGVRFESIRIERRNLLASPEAFGETTVNEVIPGFGVAYSGLPRITIYGGVHRGFSPPRAEDIIGNNGGVIELDPEESWNYELGLRGNPLRGLHLEATFFRLDYDNQIVPASLAGGVGATLTNGGETLHQGFEFTGQLDSSAVFDSRHNVYFRTAYTWLPVAEFRGVRFSSVSPAVSITGNRLPYAPETLATTAIGYSHASGFDGFIESVFVGRQLGDDLNTVNPIPNGQLGAIPAQTYFNATVNYRVEKWKTTFFATAKNLFDRTFIVDRSRGILPSSPRLVQAGLHVRF